MSYPNVVYAIHNFEAENDDEIAFNFGEPIVILEKDDQFMDGWWQGRNIQGEVGLFPMNYTSPDKPGMNRVTSVYTNKEMYNDQNSTNNGVFRRKSGSTVSSRGTTSSDKSSPKEESVIGNFGQSHVSPLFWTSNDVLMWLEYAGLDMAVENFLGQEITGDVLLNLTHDGLKELGITAYGRRYRIINCIEGLKRFAENINSSKVSLNYIRRGSTTENYPSVKIAHSLNSTISSRQGSSPKECISENSFSPSSSFYRSSIQSPKSIRPQSQDNISISSPRSNTNTISTRRSAISVDQRSSLTQKSRTSLIAAEDAPPTPPLPVKEDIAEYEGWLHKKSDRFKTWNKRWFILRDSSLFYFKNPKDNKMKGIICLQGYRVIADGNSSGNKKFGFKLYHDRERVFHFYTDNQEELKKWMQALMKTTIKRDLCTPVVSSSNMSTVSLDIAQKMRPRPPSMLMYKTKFERQFHDISVGKHPEEKTDETLMWTEDPLTEEPHQKPVIESYLNEDEGKDDEYDDENIASDKEDTPYSKNEEDNQANRPWYEINLIEWINSHLQSTKINDLSESFRSGKILIELLESVSGQTITKDTSAPDNITEAFRLMTELGVEENDYSPEDVLTGNEDKIIDMLISIKDWSESNE